MSDSSLAPGQTPETVTPDPATVKPAKYATLKKVVYGLVSLIIGGISILKFVTRNDLPGCGYDRTKDTLATIFKNKNIEYKAINDASTVSTSDDLITCSSSVTMSDGKLLIDYKIARLPDSQFEVTITSARPE